MQNKNESSSPLTKPPRPQLHLLFRTGRSLKNFCFLSLLELVQLLLLFFWDDIEKSSEKELVLDELEVVEFWAD